MSKQTMNIAFSSDDNGVEMMLVAIFSIMKNHQPDDFDIKIFIMQSGLSEESLRKIDRLEESFSNLTIKHLIVKKAQFSKLELPNSQWWISQQAYYRYILPDLLPQDSKVLYLDIDILCCGDIEKLYSTNISKHYLVAIPDYFIESGYGRWSGFKSAVGLKKSDTYINSGVLLMNLKKMRQDNKVQEFLHNAGKNRHNLISKEHDYFVDQTIANLTFQGAIKALSYEWNAMVHNYNHIKEAPKLLHFAGSHKPFTYIDTSPAVIRCMDEYLDVYVECMAAIHEGGGQENSQMLKKRLKGLYKQIATQQNELENLNHVSMKVDDIYSSYSWRVTKPLRKITSFIRKKT